MRTRLFFQLSVIFVVLLFSASVVWAPPRFYDYGNGTVIDYFTELVWLKNANCTDNVGGVSKASGLLNWTDAMKWDSGLATGVCGLSDVSQAGDWRVPTIDELKSLFCWPGTPAWLYNGCDGSNTYNPNGAYPFDWLKSQGFMSVQPYGYWSSSASPSYPDNIFGVDMFYGSVFIDYKSTNYYVWPVRVDNYVRVDGTPNYFYHSLQNAFDNVFDDSVVRTRGVTFTENLSLHRVVDLKLFGGYNTDYSSHNGVTTINGDLTIDKGSLVVDRVVIR
jgi:hypothetical protein